MAGPSSGHVFFMQRLPAQLGVTPFVVHTTYQFSQAGCHSVTWRTICARPLLAMSSTT